MDMSDMGGMDMSSGGMFTPTDQAVARAFWYAVAGCVGLLAFLRVLRLLQSNSRRRLHRLSPHLVASRPQGAFSRALATATATVRELVYSQPVHFTGRVSKYFTPLPVGRWLLLSLYWILILSFLWTGTILGKNDPMYAYKWEIVGFRAAWVSVTQIPFIYLLSCKFNPISLLTGISYERFNWLHRWAARTVFLTVIVHWSYFFTEWSIAEIVAWEMEMMTMVKYGFGAWAVITWMLLSGFGFFRNMSYEVFVMQHIAAAATLLWLLFMHVPSYARYNIWLSIAFVAFDWGTRIIWGVLRNTHLLGGRSPKLPGYSTQLENLPGDVVRLTIKNVDFAWNAGQHAYIMIPSLRPFETHPFTIANASSDEGDEQGRDLTMLIQARRGFSRSLLKAASKGKQPRAFLSGPWGYPPDLSHHETVVLVACSTGATFVLPLLQKLVQQPECVRKAILHWIIRSDEHISWYSDCLTHIERASRDRDIDLDIHIHVTGSIKPTQGYEPAITQTDIKRTAVDIRSLESVSKSSSELSSSTTKDQRELELVPSAASGITFGSDASRAAPGITRHYGRPTVETLIRPPVEAALGETAIVVCGGLAITAESRTFVAALSDERAVHKGTGAQGICLYTETYGW